MKQKIAQNVVAFRKSIATHVATKVAADQELDLLDQVTVNRELSRVWRRHCTIAEWALLTYIGDRSVGWGKSSFRASTKNIIEGDAKYSGVGLKKTAYFAAVRSLTEKGMIYHKRSKDSVVLGLNFEWEPDRQLPAPKRLQDTAQNSGKRTSRTPGNEPQNSVSRTQNRTSENRTSIIPSPAAPECLSNDFFPEEDQAQIPTVENSEPEICNPLQSVRDHLDGVQAGIEARREAKTKSVRTKPKSKLNTTDLELIWKQAMHDTFPDHMHVSWTGDQKKRIKSFMVRFEKSGQGDVLAFADWSVRNWRVVLKRNSWMKNAPEFPTVNWWMSAGIQERFGQVRSDIEELKFENRAKQSEWDRLKQGGFTDEEAHQEMAQRAAETRLRSRMRKVKDDADRKLEEATARDERAARMDGLAERLAQSPAADLIRFDTDGKAVLPHPNSPKMQAIRDEQRKAEADALLAETNPSSGPASAVPTETWEQMMERNRLARMGAQNTNDK